MVTFEDFIKTMHNRLEKRKISKDRIAFHLERLTKKYETDFIFCSLVDEDEDYGQEFCDGIKDLPVIKQDLDNPLSLVEVKDQRINQLSGYYENIQKELGEEWFPDDEEGIEYIEPINERDRFGRTPIINAVIEGDVDLVKKLVKQGADMRIRDNAGNDVLQVAIFGGCDDIVDMIKKALD